jgi:hypothetical protein
VTVKLPDKIISDSQTAFIQRRIILEEVVTLLEIIHEFIRFARHGVLFKIDFKKAYDKVRWSFVEEVMRGKGFPQSWIDQAMCTVQGGKVRININGDRIAYFKTYQGLGGPSHLLYLTLCQKLWQH